MTTKKPKTIGQLMRRKHFNTPINQAPKGFRRHNFLLVTGSAHTNCWVKTKPSDYKDGTVASMSF